MSNRLDEYRHSLSIPLFFLGTGVYRAWIELTYTNPPFPMPVNDFLGANIQDVLLAVALLLAALLWKRLYPVHEKRALVWVSAGAMALSTLLRFSSATVPTLVLPLALCTAILSSFGTAVIILLWCEFFSVLNPYRVILYFSASLLVGWVIVYFLRAMAFPQIGILILGLPFLSAACADKSFAAVAPSIADEKTQTTLKFPFKIILLMASFTFAFALFESTPTVFGGPLSSIGMLVIALIVFLTAALFTERIRVESLFRVAIPLMAVGLLLASLLVQQTGQSGLSGVLIAASYAAFLIMLMAIMCDMTYRMNVNPLWLFGLERFIRYAVFALGANAPIWFEGEELLGLPMITILGLLAIVLILFSTTLLLTDRDQLKGWSVSLTRTLSESAQEQLVNRCNRAAREFRLSSREQEVLMLLAEGDDMTAIEQKLFIANGTAKSHIQHIYKKMGVHSKQELLEKLAG